MAKIVIKGNTSQIIEETDIEHILELDKHLSFFVQGAEHTAAYRGFVNRDGDYVKWDGLKKLLTPTMQFSTGLVERVKDFYQAANKPVEIVDKRPAKSVGKSINIMDNLKKLGKEPYPYQLEILDVIDKYDRGIIKVATGGGKCSHAKSLHFTEHGILNYLELQELANIPKLSAQEAVRFEINLATPLTDKQIDKTSLFYYDGYGNSKKIISNYGYELTATNDHKIQVIDKCGDIVWKKYSELEVNDYTIISVGSKIFGKIDMSLDEAYWYGLLIGDGSYINKHYVGITNMDDHIIKFADNYATNNGIKNIHHYQKKGDKAIDIRMYDAVYRKKLKDMGFDYTLSASKTIPLRLRQLTQKPLAMLIRGIYEIDGWVGIENNKPCVCIGLSSKELVDQIHLILLNFGIVSSRRIKHTTHKDSHIITIYNGFIQRFMNEIGFDPYGIKYKALNKVLITYGNRRANTNTDIAPHQNHKLKQLWNHISELDYPTRFLLDCPIKQSTIKSWIGNKAWRNPSKQNLLTFASWCKYKLLSKGHLNDNIEKLLDDIIYVCNDCFFFDPIISIENTQSDNFDFTLPESHSFVSQGFVNHNSLIAALISAKLGKKTIIYVIGKDLLYQFHDFFSSIFDEPIGIIGDGKCEIHNINIASIWTVGQAVGMKKSEILLDSDDDEEELSKNKYINILNMMKETKLHIIDECHMSACETIQQIFKKSNPEYIYGLSGSPWRDDGADLMIESILGKYIVNIPASRLIKEGYLAQPIIRFRVTPPYPDDLGKVYQSIYKRYIVENDVRNGLVLEAAQTLVKKGYQTLVLFNSLKHGKILHDVFKQHMKCAILDGSNTKEERDQVKKDLMERKIDCILASRIFDIGVDIPSLSGLVLACGGKSTVKALQRVGRVIRKYPSKKYAVIIDFADQAPFLDNHSRTRYRVYTSEDGFDVLWPTEIKKPRKGSKKNGQQDKEE